MIGAFMNKVVFKPVFRGRPATYAHQIPNSDSVCMSYELY